MRTAQLHSPFLAYQEFGEIPDSRRRDRIAAALVRILYSNGGRAELDDDIKGDDVPWKH
jgi:hypothetical protein